MCSEHCDSLRRIEFSLLAKPGPFVLHRSLEPLLTTSSLALVGGSVSSVLFTILIPSSLFPTHDPAPRISCSSSWTCLQSTQLSFSFVSAVLSLLHFTLATRFSLDSSLSSAVPAQDTPEALRLMRSFSFSSTPTLLVHVGQALCLLEFGFFLFTCFSVPSIMLCIWLWASLPCLSFKFCFNQQVNPTRHPRSIN